MKGITFFGYHQLWWCWGGQLPGNGGMGGGNIQHPTPNIEGTAGGTAAARFRKSKTRPT